MTIAERIKRRDAKVGVIGLGYVGLPLAVEFARAGFRVTGFDVDESKVQQLRAGRSYIPDVPDTELSAVVHEGKLKATTDMSCLGDMDVIDICVPTPLRKGRDPDLSYIVRAVEEVANHVRKDTLIILESTTYPGTTDEVVRPLLEKRGLRVGEDFYLAFSPERVDPSNRQYTTKNIPKVVGGIDQPSTDLAASLYGQVVDTVVPVSSTRVAEMVKLLENTFRSVNIGLVNELALMCRRLDIDVWEVIDAAKTKPFGFMPFYPGPGLGGHCIPVDPYYLSWKARQNGFDARFIELAGQVNASMPAYVIERTAEILNMHRKPIYAARIHVYGAAYKRDVSDVRESPALDIMELLLKRDVRLSYTDPFVPRLKHGRIDLESVPEESVPSLDPELAIICTDHSVFDYKAIAEGLPLVLDTRNALKALRRPTVYRL
jgi:UDP-N-acetyl-D-glucosamine dehydrogenase